MIEIKPFRAFLYNNKRFKSFSKLLCPPYDIISNTQQSEYYNLSNYNMIRLVLAKQRESDTEKNNRYTRSAKLFHEWIKSGILVRDKKDSVYVYQQEYGHEGQIRKRRGFISLLRIQDNMIHPHEHTHLKPKEDRFQLLKHVKANLSPIFALFSDSANYIYKIDQRCSMTKPLISLKDKLGVRNILWRLEDGSMIEKLVRYIKDKDIFIADGHHRFEVACAYRDMLKSTLPDFSEDAPYNYIMSYFTSMNSPDLTIMATHRLVKNIDIGISNNILERLAKYFLVEAARNRLELSRAMKNYFDTGGVFGMYFRGRFYILRLKAHLYRNDPWHLDVSFFNKFVLNGALGMEVEDKNIIYSSVMAEAVGFVSRNSAKAAFFLNPTKISQLKGVVLENKKMPPKSTYFYPKLLSGMVIHKF